MKSMTLSNWLWLAVTVGGMVYGYGALNTRVEALEKSDPARMSVDIAVIKQSVLDIKDDVKDIKQDLKHR